MSNLTVNALIYSKYNCWCITVFIKSFINVFICTLIWQFRYSILKLNEYVYYN